MTTNTNPPVAVGDRIVTEDRRPWTVEGVKGEHHTVAVQECTEATAQACRFVVVDLLVDEGAPPRHPQTPTGFTILTSTLARDIANGTITLQNSEV